MLGLISKTLLLQPLLSEAGLSLPPPVTPWNRQRPQSADYGSTRSEAAKSGQNLQRTKRPGTTSASVNMDVAQRTPKAEMKHQIQDRPAAEHSLSVSTLQGHQRLEASASLGEAAGTTNRH